MTDTNMPPHTLLWLLTALTAMCMCVSGVCAVLCVRCDCRLCRRRALWLVNQARPLPPAVRRHPQHSTHGGMARAEQNRAITRTKLCVCETALVSLCSLCAFFPGCLSCHCTQW